MLNLYFLKYQTMKNFILLFLLLISSSTFSQQTFTRKDSLQGGLRPERTNFDVTLYNLNIKIDIEKKHIVGYNEIHFKVLANKMNKIQIDLFENMQVDSIVFENKKLAYKRDNNAVFIDFPYYMLSKSDHKIKFYYSGNPQIAKNAPWDGGFVFKKDTNNKDFVAVACQGTGASLWFPCKDSQSDEPNNGANISIEAPNGLIAVSNGRLLGSTPKENGFTRWDWQVKNPINSYNITLNIADYVHFSDTNKGLDLDYYVLRNDLEKAKIQFTQVKPMLDCFETKFGEYPFKNDGFKLVQTPYLGMEHQSCVAYGNKFQNGYLGRDISGSGIGLLFDYIIIHESGHEWFGNSITSIDIADMWIHEGFTTYAESVFVECQYGAQKAQEYLKGMSKNIGNNKPIIGNYGVNKQGSGDMYNKGAVMINTLRYVINDDAKWWQIMYQFTKDFRHQITNTESVITFFNTVSGMNLTPIFNQYLRFTNVPILQLKIVNKKLEFKWIADDNNFNLPIEIKLNNKIVKLQPTTKTQIADFKVAKMEEISVLTDKIYIKIEK